MEVDREGGLVWKEYSDNDEGNGDDEGSSDDDCMIVI